MRTEDQHAFITQPNQTTLEELLEGLSHEGKYSHIKLFQIKNDNCEIGQHYLMVCRSAFGKVKLNDIYFKDNQIHMKLQDSTTGFIKRISLDVDNDEFKFLLISWQDIRRMVFEENSTKFNHDEMLEFEF